ncbi:MAG TPA: YidC/Oxa1 family membrane protein insertase [Clostridia bacterium]|nr:YidC/Oxa1 family membrane protein insertase [Clostridia bacterium]
MGSLTALMKSILETLNGFVGNYGWSIVIFTVVFRLILLPLDIKSKKDMRIYSKQIAKLKPKLEAINKKYANDPQKRQQKTAELYKAENVSMLGGCKGCIPLLLQYPLLIAFFTVFRYLATEHAEAAFKYIQALPEGADAVSAYIEYMKANGWSFLWIKNIWMPDIAFHLFGGTSSLVVPTAQFANIAKASIEAYNSVMAPIIKYFGNTPNGFFILPLIAGGSQYIASRLTPQADPNAAQNQTMKTMQVILPLMFVYFTIISSAALALYWVVSNLISIISQYFVNKYFDYKDKKNELQQGGNVEYEIH